MALVLTTLMPGVHAQALSPTGPDPALWGLCAPDPLAVEITRDTGAAADAPLEFTADTAQSSPLAAVLEGSVELIRGDQQLRAPQVTLNRSERIVTAEGGIVYGDPTLAIRGESARIDIANRFARFNNTRYYAPAYNAQGEAETVESEYQQRRARLEGVTYSTCARGDEFWQLRSGEIELDQAAGRGVARDVTFLVRDVPVAYFPYLSFPINDERQSGFLSPRLGISEDLGFDFRLPYYWNIAPDRDMTFAPRLLSKRGLMLGLEYRFLNTWNRGEVSFEWLPDDRGHDDGDRGSTLVHLQAAPRPRLHTDLLYQSVSDHEYLDDFGTRLDLLSDTELERHLEAFYYGDTWDLYAQVETFQDIDDPDRITDLDDPYNRLPQIEFQGQWPAGDTPLNLEFYSELVHFDHPSAQRDTGNRLDLWPTLTLPLDWPYAYVYSRIGYRYTAYQLDRGEAGPALEEDIDRGAPLYSLDSGLFLERDFQWRDWSAIQTLEPRLFYLYVPFRDQDDIPLFDTAEVDSSYQWLFLENRFTGADRLGDANQLTAALTTRLLDAGDGREQFRFSVGQIYYFDDREVTLERDEPTDESRSNLIFDLGARIERDWSLQGALHWDPDERNTERGRLDLRYNPGAGQLVNLAHRYKADDLEQLDLTAVWPLNDRWRTAARYNYALREGVLLDTFVGLEYQECCWALRLLARRSRDELEDEQPENSVLAEIVFKGLGGVGSSIDNLFERAIPNYQPPRYR